MRHLTRWVFLLTLSTLVALVAPAAAPIHAAPAGQPRAAPSAPEAFARSEVVVIESNGRIRVDSPYANPVTRWTSGSDLGWQNIAAGNFDGNALGYQQIVAVRGSEIKVFRPFPTPTVIMNMTAPNGWWFDLLAVGDYDGDGLKEIAASYYQPGGSDTNIALYQYVPNSLTWTVNTVAPSPWAARWRDMQSGNVNGDLYQGRPIDDLVLVRQPGHLLKTFLGTLTQGVLWQQPDNTQSGFPYLALAVGKIHTDAGVADEAVTSRDVPEGQLNTVLLWRFVGSQFVDVTPTGTKYNPQFTSISLADVNGDGHKELLMLRDPIENKTTLKIMNLVNLADGGFEAAIGCSGGGCAVGAWKTVRGGDLDADGMDETVVLRGDQYRIYEDAAHAYAPAGALGGSFYINTGSANATSLLVTNVDGGGSSTTPVLLADPGLIDLGSVDFGQQAPIRTLAILNGGIGGSDLVDRHGESRLQRLAAHRPDNRRDPVGDTRLGRSCGCWPRRQDGRHSHCHQRCQRAGRRTRGPGQADRYRSWIPGRACQCRLLPGKRPGGADAQSSDRQAFDGDGELDCRRRGCGGGARFDGQAGRWLRQGDRPGRLRQR